MQQLRCDESETPLIFFYMLLGGFLAFSLWQRNSLFLSVFPFFSRILRFVWEENLAFFRCFSLHLAKIKKQGREGLGRRSLPKVHEVLCPFGGCCRFNALKEISDGYLC